MEEKRNKIGLSDIVLLVFCALLLIGVLTVCKPCGPKDDGSWMACHWAGNAVAGAAAVLTVLALIHLLVRDGRVKAGLSIAAIPTALMALLLPGNIISLCMVETMRCRSVMRPGVVVMSILVIAAAVFDAFVQLRKK